mgnify:CR=1 FL=1
MAYTITAGTIASRVIATLGEDNLDYIDDMVEVHELFEEAIWETATALPKRLLLTEVAKPIDPNNFAEGAVVAGTPFSLGTSEALLVIRVEAYSVDEGGEAVTKTTVKNCTEIPFEESHRVLDANSIYFATRNSPVYWLESAGGERVLQTAPTSTGQAANGAALVAGKSGVMVFKYDREAIAVTDTATTGWNVITGFEELPVNVEDIIIKRIALRIIDQKLAGMATQEEDQELFGIIQANKAVLETDIKETLMKLQGEGV